MKNNWQQVKLGSVLEKMEGGGTPSKAVSEYWDGKIPWATVKDITKFNPKDTQDHISEEGLKNSSARLISKGTLITPTRMALGNIVSFDVDVAINQDLKALYPVKDLQKEFLYYWFQHKSEYIKRLGNGSTVDGIPQNELKAIKFNKPPFSEQNRIVAVLETWDEVIEKLTRKIELKKQVKKGLMKKLLTGGMRLPGFIDQWKSVKVSEISQINPKNIKLPHSFIYIDLDSVEKGTLKRERQIILDSAPSRAQRVLQRGDILFQMVRPYQKNNLYFNKEGIYVASTGYAQIRLDDSSQYLYYILHTNEFVNKVLDKCTGSNYPAINSSDLSNIKIPWPSKEERLAIADVLTTSDKEIELLENKLQQIKQQKKYLLNNLITGAIRTPETL